MNYKLVTRWNTAPNEHYTEDYEQYLVYGTRGTTGGAGGNGGVGGVGGKPGHFEIIGLKDAPKFQIDCREGTSKALAFS